MEDFEKKASDYAINEHKNPSREQRYGNKPYSKHLTDVVNIAKKYIHYIDVEEREDVITSCWGHDLIEDTNNSVRKLSLKFNKRVAEIILSVSNIPLYDKKEQVLLTFAQVRKGGHLSRFVKLCDRIANVTNSKNGFDEKSAFLYKKYQTEYPIFRYALKIKGEYSDMWVELDELFDM